MRTIWLASYPKSGNTWLRMLIANLSAKDGKPVDINDLPGRGGIASARGPFDHITLIDSGLLSFEEIDNLRPSVYEELARGAQDDEYDSAPGQPPVRFVKCHDAYTRTPNGEPLLGGARGAGAAILIVRDPRDVAPSLASHNHSSIDDAIAFMSERHATFCGRKTDRQYNQLRQQLTDWSGHVAGWLQQTDIPVHLVRYEDMQTDTPAVLTRVLAFAQFSAGAGEIDAAVRHANFSELQGQEKDKGFREAPRPHAGGNFFRRGITGAWRDELTAEQAARIERDHGPMMRRLGYALSNEATPGHAALGEVA